MDVYKSEDVSDLLRPTALGVNLEGVDAEEKSCIKNHVDYFDNLM